MRMAVACKNKSLLSISNTMHDCNNRSPSAGVKCAKIKAWMKYQLGTCKIGKSICWWQESPRKQNGFPPTLHLRSKICKRRNQTWLPSSTRKPRHGIPRFDNSQDFTTPVFKKVCLDLQEHLTSMNPNANQGRVTDPEKTLRKEQPECQGKVNDPESKDPSQGVTRMQEGVQASGWSRQREN